MKNSYLFILFLFFVKFLSAQTFIDRWYNEEYLPQNSVKSITLDEYDFIWLATESGLARFDGTNFKLFNDFENLKTNRFDFFYSYGDSLYAKSIQQEDVLVKDRKPEVMGHKYVTKNKKPSNGFELEFYKEANDLRENQLIVQKNSIDLYFKSATKLILSYDDDDFKETSFESPIISFAYFKEELFVLTKSGIFKFAFDSLEFQKLEIKNKLNQQINADLKFSDENLSYTYSQTQQSIFLNYKNHVFIYDLKNKNIKLIHNDLNFKSENILSAYYDHQRKIAYFGSGYKGLLVTQPNLFNVYQSTSVNYVQNLIYAFDVLEDGRILTSRGLQINNDEIKDIGYNSSMIAVYMAKYKDLKYFQIIRNKIVLVDYAKEGRFKDFLITKNDLGVLFYDQDINQLYFSTQKFDADKSVALMKYDLEKEKIDTLFTLNNNISFLEKRKDNQFLIGTEKGAYFADIENRMLNLIPSTENAYVRNINIENDNTWISTYNEGLLLYKNDQTHEFPSIKNKVSKSVHHAIEDNYGYLWISTNKGLLRGKVEDLIDDSQNPVNFFNYFKVEDGLPTNEFNGGCNPCARKLPSGEILFPSLNGLVKFNPEDFLNYHSSVQIYTSEIQVNNEKNIGFKNKQEIKLPNNIEKIKIQFDYLKHNIVFDFKYQLNDGLINDVENNQILLNNLAHGSYNVQLFYPNNDLTNSLNLNIQPNFYETSFFKIVVILGAGLLTFLIVRIIVYTEKKRNDHLNGLISEKTSQLKDTISSLNSATRDLEEKVINHKKIIASISHDIRSPLQYIKLGAEFLKDELINKNLGKDIEENIVALNDSIEKLQGFTDNILEYSKALINQNTDDREEFNLHQLVTQKTELFEQIVRSKKIDLKIKIKKDFQLNSNKNLLAVIIHNVLDNALKNTLKGSINISAKAIAGKVILKIEDTGFGMDQDTLQKYRQVLEKPNKKIQVSGSGLGLFIVAEASKLLNAKVEIYSEKNKGTKFYLSINEQE